MFVIGLPTPMPLRASSMVLAVSAFGTCGLVLLPIAFLSMVTPNSFNNCFTNALFFQEYLSRAFPYTNINKSNIAS
ncbi:hypothetical protein SAMN05216524_10486 [Mucilaginibacter sp. OK098]|nr:hypothetical protein SAMN05216524_10486 [Mucilaginibacter sp. OK098]